MSKATAQDCAAINRYPKQSRNETVETLRRRKSGHLQRASRSRLSPQLIEALYSAQDDVLEKVVRDALEYPGLRTGRLETQTYGEEDLQISTRAGIVVASVTASKSSDKPIPWRKARGGGPRCWPESGQFRLHRSSTIRRPGGTKRCGRCSSMGMRSSLRSCSS